MGNFSLAIRVQTVGLLGESPWEKTYARTEAVSVAEPFGFDPVFAASLGS